MESRRQDWMRFGLIALTLILVFAYLIPELLETYRVSLLVKGGKNIVAEFNQDGVSIHQASLTKMKRRARAENAGDALIKAWPTLSQEEKKRITEQSHKMIVDSEGA